MSATLSPNRFPNPFSSFFQILRFKDLASFSFPPPLPLDSLIRFAWVHSASDVPEEFHVHDSESKDFMTRMNKNGVPQLGDLAPVLSELEVRERDGALGVVVELRCGSAPEFSFWSIQEIRTFIHIENNREAVCLGTQAYRMVCHPSSGSRNSEGGILEFLESLPIWTTVQGFSTPVRAWELGCLAHEAAVFDTVLDLRAELTYLTHQVSSSASSYHLIFPSLFASGLLQLFRQPHHRRTFSPQFCRIRLRMETLCTSGAFNGMSFVLCNGGHFTAFHFDANSGTLYVGDSLCGGSKPWSNSTAAEIISALKWLLGGLPCKEVLKLCDMELEQQNAASQSCGIIAFNGIERLLGLYSGRWTPERAKEERTRWFTDLVHHWQRSQQYGNQTPWLMEDCYNNLGLASDKDDWYSWDCWNLKNVDVLHPIFESRSSSKAEVLPQVQPMPLLAESPQQGTPRSSSPADRSAEVIESKSIGGKVPTAVSKPPAFLPSMSPLPLPLPLPLSTSQPPPPSLSASPSSSPSSEGSDRSWSGVPSSSRSSDISPASGTSVSLYLAQPQGSIGHASKLKWRIKEEPVEMVDLTGETPSPAKERRQDRLPSLIILSSDDERQSPPPKRLRRSVSTTKIGAGAQATHNGSELQGARTGCTSGPDKPITIMISSDSDSNSNSDSDSDSDSLPSLSHQRRPPLPSQSPTSPQQPSPTNLAWGTEYESMELAEAAVKKDAEGHGFIMVRGQSHRDDDGPVRKLTLRCKCYRQPIEQHNMNIHPSDHREGKSFRTGCFAHVNIRRVVGSTSFYLSLIDTNHNHPRLLPIGGHAQSRPTEQQRQFIAKYAEQGGFSRKHLLHMLETEGVGHQLEPRQMTNIMNQTRREAQAEIQALGGDIATVITTLEAKQREDPRWQYRIRMDEERRITALWWQSPAQAEIVAKYHDILINDNSYNRNQYGFPLNVGVAIDGFGASRNIWYCFQEREDAETHAWVLRCHLSTAPRPPAIFISDKDLALEAAVREVLPFTDHILCLHHLGGNISKNLQPSLGSDWDSFLKDFWEMYRSPSPDHFDTLYHQLTEKFPTAASYLQSTLYPTRHRWAHAWVSTKFTCGIRTNGRVEVENRVNKALGGPKTAFLTLFNRLNNRTDEQNRNNLIAIRQSSRRNHPHQYQAIFARPLNLIEKHASPFALNISCNEMKRSLAYSVEIIPLPVDLRAWAQSTTEERQVVGFEWSNGEELNMFDRYTNDTAYIDTPWFMELVTHRRLNVHHLLKVIFQSAESTTHHLLVLLDYGAYLCDCCMGTSLGIPCRHYFAALRAMRSPPISFHLGLIRSRWLSDPNLDISSISPVTLDLVETDRRIPITGHLLSNPLQAQGVTSVGLDATPPPPTQTISAQEVYHHVQTAVRTASRGIQTQEQLAQFMDRMAEVEAQRNDELLAQQPLTIRDPLALNPKGRPRTVRLAASREGRGKRSGGGGHSARYPRHLRTQTDSTARTDTTRTTSRTITVQDAVDSGRVTRSAARSIDHPQAVAVSHEAVVTDENASSVRRCGICRQPGHTRTRCPARP